MTNLKQAHQELFRRSPDECYESLDSLWEFCRGQKERSIDLWKSPRELQIDNQLSLCAGIDGAFSLNDWSFSQLCRLSRVSKDTVNRLSRQTAAHVFSETMPRGQKPMQLLVSDEKVRSIHGSQYARLWNSDLVGLIREFANDFHPPQKASTGGTGLYAGEQDCFLFMIDPTGWCEIDGEAFAPGFFCWNSEVGRRSIGISTFWYQSVCQNHIVWDAVDVVEFKRKHTGNVEIALEMIRRNLEQLIQKRDARRDGFYKVMQKAMRERLGEDAEEVQKVLSKHGINRSLAKKALAMAQQQESLTIFSVVSALTNLTDEIRYAGDRLEADQKASSLLDLVATAA